MVTISVEKDGAKEKVVDVPLSKITIDCRTRAELNAKLVTEYAKMLRDGVEFDPAIVYDDGEKLHLSCGEHRYHAHRLEKRTKMPCIIRKGTWHDAFEEGIRDNLQHRGQRLTAKDKRHNVEVALRNQPKDQTPLSDRAIAKKCGVSPTFVGKVRSEIGCPRGHLNARLGSDGKTYHKSGRKEPADKDQQPSKLGGRPSETPPSPEDEAKAVDAPSDQSSENEPVTAVADAGKAPESVNEATSKDSTNPDAAQKAAPESKPGEVPESEPEATTEDRCSCGADWESDGEGGRYCPECEADHPKTPSIPMGKEMDKDLKVLRMTEADIEAALARVSQLRVCDGTQLRQAFRRAKKELRTCREKLGNAS